MTSTINNTESGFLPPLTPPTGELVSALGPGSIIPEPPVVLEAVAEVEPMAQLSDEMLLDRPAEAEANPEQPTKTKRLLGRVGMAGLFAMPTADLFLSDGLFGGIYNWYADKVNMASPLVERAVEIGGMGAFIAAQCFVLGKVITSSKKVQDSFEDFNTYIELKDKEKGWVRKSLSWVGSLPYKGLGVVGGVAERAGKRIEKSDSKTVQRIGKVVVDEATISTIGTTNVVLEETLNPKKETPSDRRLGRLSSLFTVTWLGLAEGVRSVYRKSGDLPLINSKLHTAMAKFGEGYQELVGLDKAFWNTPVAAATFALIGGFLAKSGWNMAKFHEQKAAGKLGDDISLADESEPTLNFEQGAA